MPLELKPGDKYGEFEILEFLGSGGFGQVYKVQDPRYGEPLALKLSRDPVREAQTAQRALREVTVLRTLTSPHVVRIVDCGLRRDGHIFVLMEFLDGRPLDVFHDFDTKMSTAWAVHIALQSSLGLTGAHRRGIVHRDLKPANIFIVGEGHTKLLDFGLARSFDEGSIIGRGATIGHMLIGTPHYAQPEQLHTAEVTPAADVYSLSMILYELLSGRTPFFADRPVSDVRDEWLDNPMHWLRAHGRMEVVPLRTHSSPSETPDALVELVHRGLAKKPFERPGDAEAFAAALRAAWPPTPGA